MGGKMVPGLKRVKEEDLAHAKRMGTFSASHGDLRGPNTPIFLDPYGGIWVEDFHS
jgi:hypothetical protein